MNNNLNFALYNIFLAIRTSPLQRKCKYKGCASHFGPCSSRKNPFVLLFGSCLRWLTNRSPPANVTKAPALLQSTQVPVQMNLTSNVFCRYVPSLSYTLPSAAGFYTLMFYHCFIPALAVLFDLCRCCPVKLGCTFVFCFVQCVFFLCFTSQTPGLCSAFPSALVKFVTRFCCVLVRNFDLRVGLPNTGFVQWYSLGSIEVCCTLVFCFIQ